MSVAGKVLYTCPFVPAEWIAAHGLDPSRVTPTYSAVPALSGVPAGVCPYARSFANMAASATDALAVVVTTACDQMRRCSELIESHSPVPVFVLHVPHTWQEPNAVKLYRAELLRLGEFLAKLGGIRPSIPRLIEVVLTYDKARTALRDAKGSVSARTWASLAADFHSSSVVPAELPREPKPKGPALALAGGPLPRDQFGVFDLIEEAGGHVALDATESGERTLPAPIRRHLLEEDPLTAVTEAYFGSIPDPFRRPNTEFFRWMRAEINRRDIRGVVVRRYLWCDSWHAEVQRLSEFLPVPVLGLDATDEGTDLERTRTRIAAFVEGLT